MYRLLAFALLLLSIPPAATAGKFHRASGARPSSYIVVLNDTVDDDIGLVARDLASLHSGRVTDVWRHALRGFAVNMSEQQAIRLSEDPRVRFVEEDGAVIATAYETTAWNLDRIDNRMNPRLMGITPTA